MKTKGKRASSSARDTVWPNTKKWHVTAISTPLGACVRGGFLHKSGGRLTLQSKKKSPSNNTGAKIKIKNFGVFEIRVRIQLKYTLIEDFTSERSYIVKFIATIKKIRCDWQKCEGKIIIHNHSFFSPSCELKKLKCSTRLPNVLSRKRITTS